MTKVADLMQHYNTALHNGKIPEPIKGACQIQAWIDGCPSCGMSDYIVLEKNFEADPGCIFCTNCELLILDFSNKDHMLPMGAFMEDFWFFFKHHGNTIHYMPPHLKMERQFEIPQEVQIVVDNNGTMEEFLEAFRSGTHAQKWRDR